MCTLSQTTVILVVMGPCGCGKSEVGQKLADLYNTTFIDADVFHPEENVTKMRSGVPLTDEDRIPWLKRVRAEFLKVAMGSQLQQNKIAAVVGCSALKVMYRNILKGDSTAGGSNNIRPIFVLLNCSRPVLQKRLSKRSGHFMKSGMLESQLNTLEFPKEDEMGDFVVVNGDMEVVSVVSDIETQLRLRHIHL